jgi:hypothetical protein
MNKFVLGALAVSTVSTLGFAGSTDGEWSGLDRELNNLASSLNTAPTAGVSTTAFLRTDFASIDKDIVGSADDLRAFSVDNARVNFDADCGAGYSMHVSLDAAGGAAGLIDAYGKFKIGDMVTGTMGQFRAPFLWTGALDENHLIFNDPIGHGRTFNGLLASGRDKGVMLGGNFEQFGWQAALQNGADGPAKDFKYALRGTFTAQGKGVAMQEGAYNSPDEMNLVVGVGFEDFDSGNTVLDKSTAFGADVVLTQGQLYAQAEIANYSEDAFVQGGVKATPWDLTVAYMVSPNTWEVAGRFENVDSPGNEKHFGVGVNYYANGHNAKWGLEFDNYKSDNGSGEPDGTAITLSLTLGV